MVNKLHQVTQQLSKNLNTVNIKSSYEEKNIQHIKDTDSKIQNESDHENDEDKVETNFTCFSIGVLAKLC